MANMSRPDDNTSNMDDQTVIVNGVSRKAEQVAEDLVSVFYSNSGQTLNAIQSTQQPTDVSFAGSSNNNLPDSAQQVSEANPQPEVTAGPSSTQLTTPGDYESQLEVLILAMERIVRQKSFEAYTPEEVATALRVAREMVASEAQGEGLRSASQDETDEQAASEIEVTGSRPAAQNEKKEAPESDEDTSVSSSARGKVSIAIANSKKRHAPEDPSDAPPAKKTTSSSARGKASIATTRSNKRQASEDPSDTPPAKKTASSSAKSTAAAPAAQKNENKRPKVGRACNRCRVKKTRCDGLAPCDECAKKGAQCVYADEEAGSTVSENMQHDLSKTPVPASGSSGAASAPKPTPGRVNKDAREPQAKATLPKVKADPKAVDGKEKGKSQIVPDTVKAEVQETSATLPRVARACDGCRIRKTRCDGHMSCAACKQRNTFCTYAFGNGKMSQPSNKSRTHGAAGASRNASKPATSGIGSSKKKGSSSKSSSTDGTASNGVGSSSHSGDDSSEPYPLTKIVTLSVKREFLERIFKN